LGGVIDDGDQGEPPVGTQRQPAMATAIEMQEFAEAGAGLAAAPMPAAGLLGGDQAGSLQRLFDKGIAEAHAVLAPGELVEMADVEPEIALAIEGQQALDLGDGGALRRRRLTAPVQEPVVTIVLLAPPEAPDRAGAVAMDVRGRDPG